LVRVQELELGLIDTGHKTLYNSSKAI
jgi:hypothetical protein